MRKVKNLRNQFVCALLALAMTFTSLIGTTFAWFTDSVTSAGNIISAGTLEVDLQHKVEEEWISLKSNSTHKVFDYDKWEPGYTVVETLRVANTGSLALKYKLSAYVEEGSADLGENGEKLSDVIDVYVKSGETAAASFDEIKESWTKLGSLSSVISSGLLSGELLPNGKVLGDSAPSSLKVGNNTVTLALHMRDEAGNEYQKLSIGNLYLMLGATQWTYEEDSFGSGYDKDATFEGIHKASVALNSSDVTKNANNRTELSNNVNIGNASGKVSASLPSGTLLNDGATELSLTVSELEETSSGITAEATEKLLAVDVHIDGVAPDNKTPIKVTVKSLLAPGLNLGNYKLFHVEESGTSAMVAVSESELDAHNEFYYNPETGDVTIAIATFSEITTVADNEPAWKGEFDYSWYDASATDLTIANADQLAAFGALVGGMAKDENGDFLITYKDEDGDEHHNDTFDGKTVKLLSDINLGDKESENNPDIIFYPIGYWNSDGTYEKTGTAISSGFYTFQGTFDGNGNTISNFYQNTWEMKGDHDWYAPELQYFRDGMGLFGRVLGGTVKNLTVDNFSCDSEIGTSGTIAAYADSKDGRPAVFENITITNCNPRVYNIGNGGIVGCAGWYSRNNSLGNEDYTNAVTFRNITVDQTNKMSALWGSWGVSCAGILGQYYPNSSCGIKLENCHVAAIIDVNNDVCSNYQYYWYRYAGMFIGTIRANTYDENGYEIADTTGVFAEGCTYTMGNWNEYWYCEIVANTIASYTHDHQFSRLDNIYSLSEIQDGNGNWNKEGHFALLDENRDIVDCYHIFKNSEGELYRHFHDVADESNPNIYEDFDLNGDGELNDLKEDRQRYFIPFNQLMTGLDMGIKAHTEFKGITFVEDGTVKSYSKFEALDSLPSYKACQTVKLGDIVKAIVDETKIAKATMNVTVSPAVGNENTQVSAIYSLDAADWRNSTITFGENCTGAVKIVINDYYYCTPTVVYVQVEEHEHVYDNACDTDCNVCGEIREVGEHEYDNACDTDCNVCGEIREVGEHVYDNACDTDCNACGAIREVGDHVYDNDCDTDCNVCGAVREVPDHEYDDVCDTTCNVCGAERSVEHVAGDAVQENRKEAACEADGSYDNVVYCSVCGKELSRTKVIIPALGHDIVKDEAVDPDCENSGLTEGEHCTRCDHKVAQDKIDPSGHKYDAVVTAPTCTEKGYTTYTCSACGHSYTDNEVAALGHKYDAVVTAPTCTENGYTTHTCSVCEHSYTDNEVDALGHDYDAVVTAPTCTENGYTTHTCSVCGHSYKDTEVAALGHNMVIDSAKAPTCEETGLTEGSHCTRCEHKVAQQVVPASGHNMVIDSAKAPTCEETGLTEGSHCTRCEHKVAQQVVPASGHNMVIDSAKAPTCEETGLTEGSHCTRCERKVAQEVVPALGHIEKKFNKDFLYRVGNQNAVAFSSLFNVGKHAVTVKVVNIAGNAAGGFVPNDSTIEFSGTGVVKITLVASDCTCNKCQLELILEVVDATNVTGLGGEISGNVVLLQDCGLSSLTVSGRNTVYGNGFTATYTGNGQYLNSGLKQGVITVSENGTLDNLRIVAPVYPKAYMYYGQTSLGDYVQGGPKTEETTNGVTKTRYHYQLSAVAASGNATIQNCYIYGGRNNIFINTGNVTVKDTVLECGTVANIQIQSNSSHTVTFENLTTIQYLVDSNVSGTTSAKMLGAGILVGPETDTNPKIVLNGSLKQYNWVTQDDADNASGKVAPMIVEGALGATEYNHTIDGKTASNLGIIYMNTENAVVENNTGLPYVVDNITMKVSGMSVDGKVCSLQNATADQIYSDYANADKSTVNGFYKPQYKYDADLGGQKIPDEGGDEFCYRDGDTIYVMFPSGDTKVLDLAAIVNIVKYGGQNLNLVITCKDENGNAVAVTDGKIALSAAGKYTVTYTVTDTMFYDKDGKAVSGSITYSWNVTVSVSLKDTAVPDARFEFDATKQKMGYYKPTIGDVKQYLPFLAGLKIYDYNGKTEYLRFDGSSDFNKIASITITGYASNKASVEIKLTDGGVINTQFLARANSGGASKYTGSIKVKDNVVYFVNDGGTSNSASTTTSAYWYVDYYKFTGNNGTPVQSAQQTFSSTGSSVSTPSGSFSTKINYTVTYDANGGNCGQTTGYATSAATAVTLPTPTRSGYIFAGWYTEASGGNRVGGAGESYTPSANITLYAQWGKPCTVTYNANGGSCGTASEKYTGTALTLPTPTRDGYWFVGWYDAASGGNKIGDAGAKYNPADEITLYAHWQEKIEYTVTYNANGGSCGTASAKYQGTALTLPTPTRAGYTFNGWYTAASGGNKIGDAGASYIPSANITLYAQWTVKPTYTITKSESNATVTLNKTSTYEGDTVEVTVSFSQSSNRKLIVKDASGNTLLEKTAAGTYTFTMPSSNVTISASSEKSCVTSDTLVMLADGTQKRIDEVTSDDMLLVWNFYTGDYDVVPAAIIFYHGEEVYDVVKLYFEDGTTVKVINNHGFYDVELNKFIFLDETNADEYIGHKFVKVDGEGRTAVALVGYEVVKEYTGCYSIQTAVHINFMVEGMFSLTIPPIDGWFDYFEIGEDMKYDEAKMQADIEKYGLYTYEDFAEYVTYEQFIAFNGPYLKVLVGRGVLTYEQILELIATYVNP